MKVAFIHSHKFIKKNDKYYTTGGLNKEVWRFYLEQIDEIHVYARLIKDDGLESSLSSAENVYFDLSVEYKSPKDYFINKRKIKLEIKRFLSDKDAVIIRLPSLLGIVAVDVCKEKDIPYFIEVVGSAHDSLRNYGAFLGRVFANYIHNLNKKAILNAQYAIYVTQSFLQEQYPCNGQTEGVSDVQISFDENFNISNRIDKIDRLDEKNKIVFGQIGNLEVLYKGYEVFFKVLKLLKIKKPKYLFEYQIVGSGNPAKINKIIANYGLEENVKLMGKFNKKEVLSFLDDIDVYINPSYQEGLSRAVIESLSRGCPALTSNIGGTSELIESEYMHCPGDYKKLYNQLTRFLKDKKDMKRVALRNYTHSLNYIDELLYKKRKKFYGSFFNSLRKNK